VYGLWGAEQRRNEARKNLKKARAALRLLRDGMGDAGYRRENAKLRDAGRLLTPLRDATSLMEALDSLQKQYAGKLTDDTLAPPHKILHANLARARRHFHPGPARESAELNNCVKLIQNSLATAKRLKLRSIEPAHIGPGLRQIYRKGRKARAEAMSDPTTEKLHEWRKQVKYLFNASDVLSSMGSNGNGIKKSSSGPIAWRICWEAITNSPCWPMKSIEKIGLRLQQMPP